MSNLSKREKMLLYLLALVIILAGGIKFVVLPLSEQYLTLKDQLFEEQLVAGEYGSAISTQQTLADSIAQAEQDYLAYQEKLYPAMTNGQLDHLLTQYVLQFHLDPVSAEYDSSYPQDVLPFGITQEEAEKAAMEQAAASSDQTAEGDAGAASTFAAAYPQLVTNYGILVVSGTMANMIALANDVASNPAMRLIAIDAQADKKQLAATINETVYEFTLTFVIYMKD